MRPRLLVVLLAVVLLLCPRPAAAQTGFRPTPRSNPPTGENYHVEFTGGLWFPSPSLTFNVQSVDVPGTPIDGVTDLGFTSTRFYDFKLVLRPAKKHKILVDFVPIKYEGDHVLERDIAFNGEIYHVGIPVQSTLEWRSIRLEYEYDFLYRDRGFAGVIVGADLAQVSASLQSPLVRGEVHESTPTPLIGGIARVYVVKDASITAKVQGFKLPESLDSQRRYSLRTLDVDIYGTANFTNNFGVSAGYRYFDVTYRVKEDSGNFNVKGFYFAGVVRF
jgi:hypothetical protein